MPEQQSNKYAEMNTSLTEVNTQQTDQQAVKK